MRKEYSVSAFISALLLSLLCGLFYNAWKYEVERIELEEGGWQSRIIATFDQETVQSETIEAIKNFAHVKDAVINETESGAQETAIDIYFDDYGAVLSDTPRIAQAAGILPEKIVYNYELLAMYLIRDEGDTAPRLVFPMFILITALASFSLIVIIHNSFAVSMNARVHELGIFSSIGATPKQIRAYLLRKAAARCAVPVLAGNLMGIGGCMGIIGLSNRLLGNEIQGRHKAVFGYHPLVFLLTLAVTVVTIWISAWLPARKLSRLTPLEAIKHTGELQLKRRKNSPLLALLFGIEGELAGNALKAQRKALRTASISFLLSFLAFTVMQCFFSLSEISTRETYFQRYQNVWDIMVRVKDTEIGAFEETEGAHEIAGAKNITGAESVAVYQKAAAKRLVTEDEISEEMKALGGFSHGSDAYVTRTEDGWLVNAPIVILDDQSFLAYCEQAGATPGLDGAVILNQIRDVTNPDFRHPDFMPYVKGENGVTVLRQSGSGRTGDNQDSKTAGEKAETKAEILVLAYTEEVPALREEYATLDYYELVHFIPVSLWKKIREQIGGVEEDVYIRVRGREDVTLEELNLMENDINRLIGQSYTIECENRIQEYEVNNKKIQGIKAVFGGFCVLLAMIGMGNVFSNTLGFVHQRKREFARYMSVGMTPKQIRTMFCIEALVLALRPVLITLPLAAADVGYMLKISYVGTEEFLAEAPLIPSAVFMMAVFGSVALAYSLSWRSMSKISLAEVLKDDTMM